ncbi:MAG: 16S rRNA (uracil(1498)-N(3))-methyltransferase [Planctomycetes bacterium]|nr:16S rRNA (uracil(1498)-N(3))-methyltransferase [Planctomycetota bacterium]
MSERFYINCPLAPGPLQLAGPEAHHLATVCRLGAGAEIRLFNGDGQEYPARIATKERRAVILEVLGEEPVNRELPFHLEIAASLPKGDRVQFLVEKLTELGVTTFVPLLCERAVVIPGEGKLERLARHVIEASKQCGRNVLMQVSAPVDWASYCRGGEEGEMRLLAHPGSHEVSQQQIHANRIRCSIGPEGGFTANEKEIALGFGWQPVALGPRTLRVETAAIAMALSAVLTKKA